MNKERPDEVAAKSIVERSLGAELEHADRTGGVDYLSIDGCHAVEVTRVTIGSKRAGRAALTESREAGELEGELQTCWIAFVPETQPALNTLLQSLHPAVVELERAGESGYERNTAAVHILQGGPLSAPYSVLLDAGVDRAAAVLDHSHRQHPHKVIPSLVSGGSAGGSDEAVELLMQALAEKKDNPAKLMASGRENRHLFVWVDDDTRFAIARPLSREAPSWSDGGFGIPTTQPELDHAVTRLWVVHQRSRRGWLWDGATWRELNNL